MAGYLSSLSFLDLAGRLPASVAQGLFWAIVIDSQDVTDLPDFKRAPLIGRVFQDPMTGTGGNHAN